MLQRRCECGGAPGKTGSCQAPQDRRLRRSSAPSDSMHEVPGEVHEVLDTAGQPLAPTVLTDMESRFGHDFGAVRIHTDAQAAASARTVNAQAYTVGQHIVFDAGEYSPETSAGRKILAHELAHTMQQTAFAPASALTISHPWDASEQEAERLAESALQQQPGRAQGATQQSAEVARQATLKTPQTNAEPQYAKACTPGPSNPCQHSRCPQPDKIPADFALAISFVERAITAMTASPLAQSTLDTLDWYFRDHSAQTVKQILQRLNDIKQYLIETRSTQHYGCHPDYKEIAYACPDKDQPVCVANNFFALSAPRRARAVIHECAHRIGLVPSLTSVDEEYRSDAVGRFRLLDTAEALANADSVAAFTGALAEGESLTWLLRLPSLGADIGITPAGQTTWVARMFLGVELQHPVLSFFSPTFDVGMSIIGSPLSPSSGGATANQSVLVSMLSGIRIGSPRPGSTGEFSLALFGGPALSIQRDLPVGLGAELGAAFGYQWRFFEFSVGVGYDYAPARGAGEQLIVIGGRVTFVAAF